MNDIIIRMSNIDCYFNRQWLVTLFASLDLFEFWISKGRYNLNFKKSLQFLDVVLIYHCSLELENFLSSCCIIKLPHIVHSAANIFSISNLSWSRAATICSGMELFWFLDISIWVDSADNFCLSFWSFWPSSGSENW